MRIVSTWLSFVGHTLGGTVCLCSLAVFLGYFPFTTTLGAGWDGWFVGEKVARLSMVAIAGRAIVLPLLVVGLVVALVEVLLLRLRCRLTVYSVSLAAVAIGSSYIATRSIPGVGLVTPDVTSTTLFASVLFAANRIHELVGRRGVE